MGEVEPIVTVGRGLLIPRPMDHRASGPRRLKGTSGTLRFNDETLSPSWPSVHRDAVPDVCASRHEAMEACS